MEVQEKKDTSLVVKEVIMSGELEESKAEELMSMWAPMLMKLKEEEAKFNEITKKFEKERSEGLVSTATSKEAREQRLKLVKMRTAADKVRKAGKDEYMLKANIIQSAFNAFKYATQSKEKALDGIEKYYEIEEKKRVDALYESRKTVLDDLQREYIPSNLGEMPEDDWKLFKKTAEQARDQEIAEEKAQEAARLEAERIEKLNAQRKEELLPYWNFLEDRTLEWGAMEEEAFKNVLKAAKTAKKKDDEEKERVKAELEEERKRAAEKEKLAAELKAKKEARASLLAPYIVFIRDYNGMMDMDDKAFNRSFEDIKKGAELQWAEDKKKREAEEEAAKLKAEEEAREKVKRAAELKRLKDAEEKEKAEKARMEAEKQAKLAQGDEDNREDLIEDLNAIKAKYEGRFESQKNQNMFSNVKTLIDKITNHIETKF